MLNFNCAKGTEIGRVLCNNQQDYEQEVVLLLNLLLTNKNFNRHVFIDCGSNVGYFPLLAAELAKRDKITVDIYAHEPFPEIVDVAKKLMTENHLFYHLDSRAISNEDNVTSFFISNKSDASNSLNKTFRKSKGVIEVETVTIDSIYLDLLKSRDPTNVVMMIDVETYEPEVLEGAKQFINLYQPSIICEVLAGRTESHLEKILSLHGYEYYRFTGNGWSREDRIVGDATYRFRDWLFIPRDSWVISKLSYI